MTIEEKINDLISKGISRRNVAKQLNIPFHKVTNTLYPPNRKLKPHEQEEKEVRSMIKEAKKIISSAKEGLAPININNSLREEFIDLKNIAYFHQIANQIDKIDKTNKQIEEIQILIDDLNQRRNNGDFLDKDERGTISTLIRLYERISDDTKNNSVNIKETLQSIAGSIQSGLIPKKIEPIAEKSEAEKESDMHNLVKLEGIF